MSSEKTEDKAKSTTDLWRFRIYWHYVAAEFLNSQTLFLLFVYVVFHQKL